jgi:hypothetical protein
MKLRKQAGVVLKLATLIALVLLGSTADAQAYRVIYDFGYASSDGWLPVGVPVVAKNGDLYGVTESGGIYNLGSFFKLTAPRTLHGAWTHTVLYDFPGSKGGEHPGLLLIGGDGNLYGADFGQTIFELKPPTSRDGAWKYFALYTLDGQGQGSAIQGLVFDPAGNIYGTTELGGDLSCGQNGGCGTVFELKRPTKSGGMAF